MEQGINIIFLIIWISQLIMGVIEWINGGSIHPAIFLCAVMICIMHFCQFFFENTEKK